MEDYRVYHRNREVLGIGNRTHVDRKLYHRRYYTEASEE
jgi:hypothetical protein